LEQLEQELQRRAKEYEQQLVAKRDELDKMMATNAMMLVKEQVLPC